MLVILHAMQNLPLYCRLHVSTKEVIGDESVDDESADDDERQQIKVVKKSHAMMVVYIQSMYQLTVTHLPSWNRKCGWIKKRSHLG